MKLRVGQTAIVRRVPHGHKPPKGYKPTDGAPAHHDKYGKNHVRILACRPPKKKPSKTRSS